MAGRILNRRELRKQGDEAEHLETVAVPTKKRTAKKTAAVPKVRKARAKKAPPRLCARWGVFDAAMKRVAIFDFNQRAAADAKLADLLATKKGSHFMQMVKEAMPEVAAAEPASE